MTRYCFKEQSTIQKVTVVKITKARDNATQSGLVLLSSSTIGNAVSTITVSNVFSSTYDNYRVMISSGTHTVNGNYIYIKFNNSSGSTYYSSGYYELYTGGAVNALAQNAGSALPIGITHVNSTNLIADISGPYLAVYTGANGGSWAANDSSGLLNGVDKNAVSNTGFTISFGAGNITGGTISVYGYRKN